MLLKRALALLVVALAVPYACAPIYRFPAARPFAGTELYNPYARLRGQWQRANLHAHGRAWMGLTSGRQTDDEVVRAYRARGYAIAGVSDYFRIAAHRGVPTLPLYEHGMNIGKHHQVAIGARYVDWYDLPLWQGVNQEQYIINRVRASADLIALAHPSISPTGYTEPDLARLTGYDLFEVVNGRFAADELWDVALSSGRAAWAIADDDTHDVEDPDRAAVAWNMIDSPSVSLPDVVAALRAGRTYAVSKSGGAPDATDATLTAVAVEGGVMTVALSAPAAISFIGQNGREIRTALNTTTASYRFAPADTYVRTVVRTPHTVMYLNPIVRYDGRDLGAAPATIDGPRTWAVRAALALGCAAALFFGWRRPNRGDSAAASPLRRASSFTIFLAVALASAAPASAQTPAPPAVEANAVGSGPPLGSTLTFDLLRDLPTSENLFSVLETTQADIISDRFTGGGVNYGTPARVGAFGGTWTQTMYRIGDVNVTDGAVDGAPLFFPEVSWWQSMNLATGVAPADVDAAGAIVTLEPRAPAAAWTREVEADSSFGGLTGKGGSLAVPIQKPTAWNHARLVASGPLPGDRGGVFFAGSWTGASQLNRANPNDVSANVGSAFANLLLTPTDRDDVKTVAILQRVSRPDPYQPLYTATAATRDGVAAHVQSTWQRRGDDESSWRVFGSYTQRSGSDTGTRFTSTTVERLSAGPIPDLVSIGSRTDRRWSAGGRYVTAAREMGFGNHVGQFGADATGVASDLAPGFTGSIGESVAGVPARVWQYGAGTADMRHHATTLAIFAADRIETPSRLMLDVALRYETVGGSADGAANGIRWNSVLPRAAIRYAVLDRFGGSLFAAYERAAYQLPIDALSWGDPNGPTAAIYKSNPGNTLAAGPLVGRWGPGTGGDRSFSSIDPNLKRPYSDQVTFGIDAHPTTGTRFQLAAIGKWDRNLLGVVNRSTAPPAYAILGVPDPGLDLASPADDQVIPVGNLVLNPFLPYRYNFTLTNPADDTARMLGVKLSAEARTEKLFVLLGATAGLAEGNAPSVGFGPTENDPGVLGDAYVNPNSALNPRGRLFNDRAFTIKLTTIYKLPWDVRVGAIARYQDGQPFARLVIVPGLNQGAEAVRAFTNGGSRFTFTGTLDVRLQKEFAVGAHRAAIVIDGYNIVPLGNEVEEIVLTGPSFRTPTAVQPPPTFHVGARFMF